MNLLASYSSILELSFPKTANVKSASHFAFDAVLQYAVLMKQWLKKFTTESESYLNRTLRSATVSTNRIREFPSKCMAMSIRISLTLVFSMWMLRVATDWNPLNWNSSFTADLVLVFFWSDFSDYFSILHVIAKPLVGFLKIWMILTFRDVSFSDGAPSLLSSSL